MNLGPCSTSVGWRVQCIDPPWRGQQACLTCVLLAQPEKFVSRRHTTILYARFHTISISTPLPSQLLKPLHSLPNSCPCGTRCFMLKPMHSSSLMHTPAWYWTLTAPPSLLTTNPAIFNPTSWKIVTDFANQLPFGPHPLPNHQCYSLRIKMNRKLLGIQAPPFFCMHEMFQTSWWNFTFSVCHQHSSTVQPTDSSPSGIFRSPLSARAPYFKPSYHCFVFDFSTHSPLPKPTFLRGLLANSPAKRPWFCRVNLFTSCISRFKGLLCRARHL